MKQSMGYLENSTTCSLFYGSPYECESLFCFTFDEIRQPQSTEQSAGVPLWKQAFSWFDDQIGNFDRSALPRLYAIYSKTSMV